MAQLIVRDIDKAVVSALKRRAAEHGRSAEAEHREILRDALKVAPARSLKQHLLELHNALRDVAVGRALDVPRDRARTVRL
jgi:plasmid stability protein